MLSVRIAAVVALAASACALPTSRRLTDRQLRYHEISRRQNDAATALGLNDFDILQLYVPHPIVPPPQQAAARAVN